VDGIPQVWLAKRIPRLADINEGEVMSASNCTDLDHCECVDGLHKRIAELEQQLAELREGIANAMLCDTVVQMSECLDALLKQEDCG
jgi:hypothetical protein